MTPRKSGKQTIEPFVIDLVASVPTRKRDFFNMTISENINYSVSLNSLSINVLDLPVDGRPDNFSGAIGSFSLSVDLDKDSDTSNKRRKLTAKIAMGSIPIIMLFNIVLLILLGTAPRE